MNENVKTVIKSTVGVLGVAILLKAGIKTAKYFYDKSSFKKNVDIKKRYEANNAEMAELTQQYEIVKLNQRRVEMELLNHFNAEKGALDPEWKEWKFYSERQKNLAMMEQNISYMMTTKRMQKQILENSLYSKNLEKAKIIQSNETDMDYYRRVFGNTFVDTVMLRDRPMSYNNMPS